MKQIYLDNQGVWLDEEKGFGINWEEIYDIAVCQLDAVTEIYWYLDIGFEYGEYIEIYSDYQNFELLIAEIAKRFDLPNNWFETTKKTNQKSLIVWKKEI